MNMFFREAECNFPVVSTYWYTVLCGEQEGNIKKTRYCIYYAWSTELQYNSLTSMRMNF